MTNEQPDLDAGVFFRRNADGVSIVIEKGSDGAARLLHFSSRPFDPASVPVEEKFRRRFTLAEVHLSGEDQHDHHGGKHTGSNPGDEYPRYVRHKEYDTPEGRKLEVFQCSEKLEIISHLQFFNGLPVVRCWTEVSNVWKKPVGLEYVSSFALTGLTKTQPGHWTDQVFLHIPRNSWMAEFQWIRQPLSDYGLTSAASRNFTMQRAAFSNSGSMSSKELLPMGLLETAGTGELFFWQIEAAGSWHWEVGDIAGQLYLQLSGPTERENLWWKKLQPGETFISVPIAIGVADQNPETAFNCLNDYRRVIRRPHPDNCKLPVFFNDYMNCLMGDPTTGKLLPIIDTAADLGAEYFVIDGGWYGDGAWWGGVGEWLPSRVRFPGGIEEPISYIRKKDMVPGLWLEIERMGVNCRLAVEWPDECFFMRHGERVIDHQSYQLDFRHPKVIQHANEVVSRIVENYGCGFIKMDYNIDIGPGTETDSDSFGDGLLGHQRAYHNWIQSVLDRYPDLIIEHCSSGGMRLTYGFMDIHSLCSTTDNQNYLENARISINSATGVCPEQAGVWAYPLADSDEEAVVMNMVSALSWRPYFSGQMHRMGATRLDLVKEAVALYKTFRRHIPQAQLVWPIGLVDRSSGWGAFGLQWNDELLLSVWRFESDADACEFSLPYFSGRKTAVECIYPAGRPVPFTWNSEKSVLTVSFSRSNMARVFRVTDVEKQPSL